MELKKITREELDRKIELHELWLNNEEGGERLDLSNHDLRGFDLSSANLSHAILTEINLSWANLYGANLTGTILTNAILTGAILTDANLTWANLTWANLTRANLTWANLYKAILTGADLRDMDRSFTSLYLSCKSLGAKNDVNFINQLAVHMVDAIKSLPEEEREEYASTLKEIFPHAKKFRSHDESLDELLERKKEDA